MTIAEALTKEDYAIIRRNDIFYNLSAIPCIKNDENQIVFIQQLQVKVKFAEGLTL